MLNEEKNIKSLSFFGKKTDWDSWSEKFLCMESGRAIKSYW